MDKEVLKMVDAIHREKNIDKNIIFKGLEGAIETVAAKKFPFTGEIRAHIDRETGDISIFVDDDPIDPKQLGRIAAQNVYQIIMQKIKEAENDVLYKTFKEKEGKLVSGTVRRIDRGNILVDLGEIDAFLPASEQVRDEKYQLGERIRCVVKKVTRTNAVSVILSRSSEQLVRCLFELEIPEISNRTIEIMGVAREPGVRSKVAVHSSDAQIDCIGACVGVKGSRIWAVINEINEKIDIIKWNDDPRVYIANALSPAEIRYVELSPFISRARVIVEKDQIPLAIGKSGLNIQLSSRLTGWDIDIYDTKEIQEVKKQGKRDIASLPGVGPKTAESIFQHHVLTLEELIAFGVENLLKIKGISDAKARQMIESAKKTVEKRKSGKEEGKEEEESEP